MNTPSSSASKSTSSCRPIPKSSAAARPASIPRTPTSRPARLSGIARRTSGNEPPRVRAGDEDRPRPQLQHCRFTKWDRKQYYYPDLPKGYQISQYDLRSVTTAGWKSISIRRPAKSGGGHCARPPRGGRRQEHARRVRRGTDSQVDLNRAGTPLLEIVSQPDLRSAREAALYLDELRLLLCISASPIATCRRGAFAATPTSTCMCIPNPEKDSHTHRRNQEPQQLPQRRTRHRARGQAAVGRLPETGRAMETLQDHARLGCGTRFHLSTPQQGRGGRLPLFPRSGPRPRDGDGRRGRSCSRFHRRNPQGSPFPLCDDMGPFRLRLPRDRRPGAGVCRLLRAVAVGCGDGKQAANWATQDILRK